VRSVIHAVLPTGPRCIPDRVRSGRAKVRAAVPAWLDHWSSPVCLRSLRDRRVGSARGRVLVLPRRLGGCSGPSGPCGFCMGYVLPGLRPLHHLLPHRLRGLGGGEQVQGGNVDGQITQIA
jgi:hypothetical protein